MEKGTNAPVFPNAELIVNGAEYNWWTEPGRVDKLAEGRKAAGKRIADGLPDLEELEAGRGRRGSRSRRSPVSARLATRPVIRSSWSPPARSS